MSMVTTRSSVFQSFKRAQIVSLVAGTLDFLFFVIMIEVVGIWSVLSVFFSAIVGAIVHFRLSRMWVFKAKKERSIFQAVKYIPVAIGSILLNSLGFYLLNGLMRISILASKVIASLIVGWGFNFTLHRYFVFCPSKKIGE